MFVLYLLVMIPPVFADNSNGKASLLAGLYRYKTITGPEESFFIWEKSLDNNHVVITVNDHDNDRVMVNRCRQDGYTTNWLLKEKKDTEIRAERNDKTLHIYGTREGKPLDETYTIDQRPWYQPLSFSLTAFLFSGDTSISFWTFRQDTLDLVSIEAKILGLETVFINSQDVPAFKVEIRLNGFLSLFWHATYWYRQENGQFLKYRAISGPPGSDETVISLVGKLSS